MRAIPTPRYDAQEVYQTCINSIYNQNLRNRLNHVTNNIIGSAQEYVLKATTKKLFSIPPNHQENNDFVIGEVTKKELQDVYSVHMVGRAKPARAIYDRLLSLAPLGRCPFCGMGYASTLDHYLPKSKYPLLSVLPLNLIPSCLDCNKEKHSDIARAEAEQCLHPYFDHQHFIDHQWLFAGVTQTSPASICFYVEPPAHWDQVSQERVKTHFNDFKLSGRFSIEASNQLANLRYTLIQHHAQFGLYGVKNHLAIEAASHLIHHRNSWQTAMFQALAASDWYCDGGFN